MQSIYGDMAPILKVVDLVALSYGLKSEKGYEVPVVFIHIDTHHH